MAKFNIDISVNGAQSTGKALESVGKAAATLESRYSRVKQSVSELYEQQSRLQSSISSLNSSFKAGAVSEAQFSRQSKQLSIELTSVSGRLSQAQSRMTSLKATMDQAANSTRSLGNETKRLQAYSNDFTSGIRSANTVAVEFSRIIQDAPYGMQGIANNIQQLTQNWGYYTRAAKEAAAASGQTVSTKQLLGGALRSLASPINLLTLGISAVTAGWVAYEKWQQKSNKSTREAKAWFDELSQSAAKYASSLSLVNQAQLSSRTASDDERIRLNALRSVIEDASNAMSTRLQAVKNLRSEFPGYFADIKSETLLAGGAATAYENLARQSIATEQARANASKLADSSTARRALEAQLSAEMASGKAAVQRRKELERIIEAETTIEGRTARNTQYRDEINRLQKQSVKSAETVRDIEGQLVSLVSEEKLLIEGINEATKTSIELFKSAKTGVDGTNSSLKAQEGIISGINDSLRGLREQSILSGLQGQRKEIQAARFRFDALERAAEDFGKRNESAFKKGSISASEFGANLERIAEYMRRIQGFEVGEIGRIVQQDFRPRDTLRERARLNRPNQAPVVLQPVQLGKTQIAKIDFGIDFKDFTNGLKRATNQFTREFVKSLTNINDIADRTFRGIFATLGTSLLDSFSGVFQNALANKLETVINDALDNVSKGIKGGEGWIQAGVLAAGVGGSIISGATKRTSIGGKAIGGALTGAATGFTVGGPWGALAGAIIGGITGIFSGAAARKQEKISEAQLAEQKRQTALMERQAALAYTSQIIGQMTNQGIVTGAGRNEFGDITFRIQGRELVGVMSKEQAAQARGL